MIVMLVTMLNAAVLSAESGAAPSGALTETPEVLNVISKLNGTEYRKPKHIARISGGLPRLPNRP